MKIEMISAQMLDLYAKRDDTVVIDVRDRSEYLAGHICGAINIPANEINRISTEKTKIIVLYCDRGAKSIAAASQLLKRGYMVKSVIGGITAYKGRNICRGL